MLVQKNNLNTGNSSLSLAEESGTIIVGNGSSASLNGDSRVEDSKGSRQQLLTKRSVGDANDNNNSVSGFNFKYILIGFLFFFQIISVVRGGRESCRQNATWMKGGLDLSLAEASVCRGGTRSVRTNSSDIIEENYKRYIADLVQGSMERYKNAGAPSSPQSAQSRSTFFRTGEACAFLFYGLPRSFLSSSLPSIIENILVPNAHLDCHAFVAYHDLPFEQPTLHAGYGGSIDADQVLLLEEAMRQVGIKTHKNNAYQPVVRFCKFSDQDFAATPWGSVYRNATRNPAMPIFPTKHYAMNFDFVDRILRMWYSQERAWDMLEMTARHLGNVTYTRAAMLRSDLFYMTPVPLFEYYSAPTTPQVDIENQLAWYPTHPADPVPDTMIVGPAVAVKAWAGGIPGEDHWSLLKAALITNKRKNWEHGMQPQAFTWWTLFPAMERQNATVINDVRICACRVRANNTIWLHDCELQFKKPLERVQLMQTILGTQGRERYCERQDLDITKVKYSVQYHCPFPQLYKPIGLGGRTNS